METLDYAKLLELVREAKRRRNLARHSFRLAFTPAIVEQLILRAMELERDEVTRAK